MNEPERLRLLVIDDDEVDQLMCARVLAHAGMACEPLMFAMATDALEHLRLNNDERIDAFLVDINLPRMNGFEFLRHLRAELPRHLEGAAVALISTSINPLDQRRAEQCSCIQAFFQKPLTVAHVSRLAELAREARERSAKQENGG